MDVTDYTPYFERLLTTLDRIDVSLSIVLLLLGVLIGKDIISELMSSAKRS